MRLALYALACAAGLVLALLGDEPLLGLAFAAVIAYPLGIAVVSGDWSAADRGRSTTLGGAVLAGVAGTLLVVLLIRLAAAAPGWVDPLAADCGGPSTGAQQLATWFAALVFVLAAVPEAVNLAALGGRLSRSEALSSVPLTLSLFPLAVAAAGIALIVASWATSC